MTEKPLRGIIVPMITPLKDNHSLDIDGLEKLIEHVLAGGVHGLFILGTTGEGPGLSYELRRELVQRTCRLVRERVPVLVGISDTAVTESIRLAEYASEQGADAVVSTPPYYFSTDQSELITYFQYLANHLPLPLYLYNMPSHTKVAFDPATVKVLAENSRIIGFKDSSAHMVYFQSVIHEMRDRPDFSLLVGPEEALMQTVLSGGHGGVNGGSNMFPALYVAMYEAAVERDFERMMPLQQIIRHISATIYSVNRSASGYLRGLKCALEVKGLCSGFLAEPYHAFEGDEKAAIKRYVEQIEKMLKN